MKITSTVKSFIAFSLCAGMIFLQSFSKFAPQQQQPPQHEEEKPKNLKVLPKDMSAEDVHKIMKVYAKALGVRCGHCHVAVPGTPPKMDFASDDKEAKTTARSMMKMVDAINEKYIDKIGKGKFEKIECVTCHMGHTTPLVSVDSLPSKPREPFRGEPSKN
jgi:hypothetical protein